MQTVDALHKLALVAGLLTLTACGGGGGGSGSKVDALTLAGKIVAPLPDGADVTVTVDAKPYVTKADENGNFEVEIESTDSDALVTILTKLAGSVSFVELTGKLGTFGDLASDAGDDNTLTADENIRTNVTSLSTAEAALLEEVQGSGKAQRKSFTFGDGVDVDEALTLAAVIELAINDPDEFALPDGASTTLDLARSATLRSAFADNIEERAPENLEQTKQNLIGNIDVVGSNTESGVPPDLLAALAGRENDYPFLAGSLIAGFEFDADGSGRYFNASQAEAMQWSRDGNRLIVEVAEGVAKASAIPCADPAAGFRESQFEIVRLSPRAVSVTTSYVSCGSGQAPPATTRGRLAVNAETTLPLSAAELTAGTYALPVLGNTSDPKLPQPINVDRVIFNADGTGHGGFIAGNFTWVLTSNVLTVSFGNDAVGTYRVVREIDGVARAFAADIDSPAGRFADLLIGFGGGSDAAFAEAEIPGRYFQFGIGDEQSDVAGREGFRLRFEADRIGFQEDDASNPDGVPQPVDNRFFVWTLQAGGNLVLRRYYERDNQPVACNPASSDACTLYDTRVIVPVNRVGERYYWIERRRFNTDTSVPYASDARFYDRVPLSG